MNFLEVGVIIGLGSFSPKNEEIYEVGQWINVHLLLEDNLVFEYEMSIERNILSPDMRQISTTIIFLYRVNTFF